MQSGRQSPLSQPLRDADESARASSLQSKAKRNSIRDLALSTRYGRASDAGSAGGMEAFATGSMAQAWHGHAACSTANCVRAHTSVTHATQRAAAHDGLHAKAKRTRCSMQRWALHPTATAARRSASSVPTSAENSDDDVSAASLGGMAASLLQATPPWPTWRSAARCWRSECVEGTRR